MLDSPDLPIPSQLGQFVREDVQAAMVPDGLANSHPIFATVNHPFEVIEIFDEISYKKVRIGSGSRRPGRVLTWVQGRVGRLHMGPTQRIPKCDLHRGNVCV